MAKKVTVSIPDMLHEQMEKWRASFNLSKMFQDAVAEAIQKKEDFQRRIKEDIDMTDVIERLKREKDRLNRNYFDMGREDGLMWARCASYEDIQYALNWNNVDNACHDPILGGFFADRAKESVLMANPDGGVNESMKIFISGWRKGLAEFWAEVKDKI